MRRIVALAVIRRLRRGRKVDRVRLKRVVAVTWLLAIGSLAIVQHGQGCGGSPLGCWDRRGDCCAAPWAGSVGSHASRCALAYPLITWVRSSDCCAGLEQPGGCSALPGPVRFASLHCQALAGCRGNIAYRGCPGSCRYRCGSRSWCSSILNCKYVP